MHSVLYEEMWQCEERHWWFLGRRRILKSLVKRYQPTDDGQRLAVCDLGCGCGANLAIWANEHDVLGVDTMPQALEYARLRLGDRVRLGTLPHRLPVDEGSQDVVLLADVLEHVRDDADAASRALGLLKPGGILIATVPAYQWLTSPRDIQHQHFRRYSTSAFRKLFTRDGVRIELLSHYNMFLFPAAAVVRLASRFTPLKDTSGDLRVPAAPVNWALRQVFGSEKHLLPWLKLPFGLSLVVVARRCDDQSARQAA
jgi:SAM-dependent methyltransferase